MRLALLLAMTFFPQTMLWLPWSMGYGAWATGVEVIRGAA
jgi:hypothetical protein